MYCTSSAPYETIPLRQNFAQGDIWGKYLFQVKERERERVRKREWEGVSEIERRWVNAEPEKQCDGEGGKQ